jgi:hypothetical protein
MNMAGGHDFNEVLFEDVQVPADSLLGKEGAGSTQVMSELAFERTSRPRLRAGSLMYGFAPTFTRVCTPVPRQCECTTPRAISTFPTQARATSIRFLADGTVCSGAGTEFRERASVHRNFLNGHHVRVHSFSPIREKVRQKIRLPYCDRELISPGHGEFLAGSGTALARTD